MSTQGMWVQPQQAYAYAQPQQASYAQPQQGTYAQTQQGSYAQPPQQGWPQPYAQPQQAQAYAQPQQGWPQPYAQPQQAQAYAQPQQGWPQPHAQAQPGWQQAGGHPQQQQASMGQPQHMAPGVPFMYLWVVNDSKQHPKAYRIKVHRSITLRQFTRCLQHKCTYGLNKASMRLKNGWSPEGPWSKFFSFRFMTKAEEAMYDRPLSELGVDNDMWFRVEQVMSGTKMAVIGVGTAVALPIVATHVVGVAAASGVVAAAGVVTVLVAAKLAVGWGANKTFKYVAVKLAPDLPSEVMEIMEVYPAE